MQKLVPFDSCVKFKMFDLVLVGIHVEYSLTQPFRKKTWETLNQ